MESILHWGRKSEQGYAGLSFSFLTFDFSSAFFPSKAGLPVPSQDSCIPLYCPWVWEWGTDKLSWRLERSTSYRGRVKVVVKVIRQKASLKSPIIEMFKSIVLLVFKHWIHVLESTKNHQPPYLIALIFQMLQKCDNNVAFTVWYDSSHPTSHHIPASPTRMVAEKGWGNAIIGMQDSCTHEHSSRSHTSPWCCSCQQKFLHGGGSEHPEGNPHSCKPLQAGFGEGERVASQEQHQVNLHRDRNSCLHQHRAHLGLAESTGSSVLGQCPSARSLGEMLDVKSLWIEAVKRLDCDNMTYVKTGAKPESLFLEDFLVVIFSPAMHGRSCDSPANAVQSSLSVVHTSGTLWQKDNASQTNTPAAGNRVLGLIGLGHWEF